MITRLISLQLIRNSLFSIEFVSDNSVERINDHSTGDEFENENPLNEFCSSFTETILVSKCPHVISLMKIWLLQHLSSQDKFRLHTKRGIRLIKSTHT